MKTAHRWYQVNPILSSTLLVCLLGWVALLAWEETRGVVLSRQIPALNAWLALHGQTLLNLLAGAAVFAALVEGARSIHRLRKLRRKFVTRSLRLTQRLSPGYRSARA